MATYSNNTTLKANAAISASTAGFANGNLYTAPANGYAILNLALGVPPGAASNYITIGGSVVALKTQGASRYTSTRGLTEPNASQVTNGVIGPDMETIVGVYVGPGQTVASLGAGGVVYAHISGVEFVNTP